MNWISLALALLKLANSLFGWLHDRGVIKAEDDRLFALQIAEMARRSTTIKQVAADVAKMTDQQVIDALQKSGDLRD